MVQARWLWIILAFSQPQHTESLESSSDQSRHLRLSTLPAFLTKIHPAVPDIGSSANFVNKLLFLGWTD